MSTMQTPSDESTRNDTQGETTEPPFEERSFRLHENADDLCERFDLAWETPLDVARELRHDNYEKVGSRCIEEECVGHLWADAAGVVCDKCGRYIRKDERVGDERALGRDDPWTWLFEHRPTYRSGRRKCVGGLAHYEWYSNDELDATERIGELEPGEFYR
jgi:hypothetical protein